MCSTSLRSNSPWGTPPPPALRVGINLLAGTLVYQPDSIARIELELRNAARGAAEKMPSTTGGNNADQLVRVLDPIARCADTTH